MPASPVDSQASESYAMRSMEQTASVGNLRTATRLTGFSLTELLVALAVGLLVVAGLHRIFVAGITTQNTTSVQTQLNRRAQVAMDDMMSRLRGGSDVIEANADRIWFTDQDGLNVRYWLSEGELLRYRSPDPGSYSGGLSFAKDVSGLSFEYYDSDGTPVVAAGDTAAVVVSLTVERAGHSSRLRSAVWLRNS